MHIHAGNRIIVSDRKIIGIFNVKTIFMSPDNKRYFNEIKSDDKTIVVDKFDKFLTTGVSSYTIINRTKIKGNFVWRRSND